MNKRTRRPVTPAYVIFYVLFSTDTWRILIGVILAVIFTPRVLTADLHTAGRVMVYVMVATIGWALSGKPARWITAALKKALTGGR